LERAGRLFRISEAQLIEVKREFGENAGRAVFFGRFVAFLRILASPMAGIVEMPFPQFMLFNLAGATVWASVMVTLSFFLGRIIPLEQLISWVAKFALVALILVVAWFVVPGWLESRKQKQSSVSEQPPAPGE